MSLAHRLSRCRCLLFPAAVCAGLVVWSFPTLLIVKKVIALLVLPAGMVWLGLMVLAAWNGIGRMARIVALVVLVMYTVAGNAWIGSWLMGKLEQPYIALNRPAEPMDAIFVLGGGSSVTPAGETQLGPAGDRLMLPARMFLTGKTRHLVASGLSVTDVRGNRSLADDTAMIWNDLGIPESAITRLSSPRNTVEEIREFKQVMARRGWKNAGICSSAWHLRRVERTCRNQGVTLTPVPADFQSAALPWSPLYAVPQSRGFQDVQKALWEFLGAATGG